MLDSMGSTEEDASSAGHRAASDGVARWTPAEVPARRGASSPPAGLGVSVVATGGHDGLPAGWVPVPIMVIGAAWTSVRRS